MMALSEVDRRQQYMDKMIGEAKVLRPLVEECLDNDPAVRPTIATICDRIQLERDAYMRTYQQNVITLPQQLEQQRLENVSQQEEIELQRQNLNIELERLEKMQKKQLTRLESVNPNIDLEQVIVKPIYVY